MSVLNEIPRKSPDIIARRTGDEYVLVPVTNHIADMTSMYTLNETGAFIWDMIDGSVTAEEIAKALASEYNTDIETTRRDVKQYLRDLDTFLITER